VVQLLEAIDVTKRFGGLVANDHISMSVNEGEILGLIGPNGAGKTTLFNCIAGHYSVTSGTVKFQGRDITRLAPEEVCLAGIARTWQVVQIFRGMTILENVMVGAFCRTSRTADAQAEAMKVLEFTGLADKRGYMAADVTIADKKRIELSRALATKPVLIMLDEAMAGLNPKETTDAVQLIKDIRDQGITVLMVEHVMECIMPISDRIVVLNYGRKIAEGPPAVVCQDEEVVDAYLGEKYHA
jgi:branched-chain amino acid transport system ATP-binding protein